jgi:hypothetical protein
MGLSKHGEHVRENVATIATTRQQPTILRTTRWPPDTRKAEELESRRTTTAPVAAGDYVRRAFVAKVSRREYRAWKTTACYRLHGQ